MVFGDIQLYICFNSFLEGCPETCTLRFLLLIISHPFFSNLLLSSFIFFSLPGITLEEKITRSVFIISKNLFLKAANKKVLVRKNLSSLVEDILLKTVLSLISLSRKSGAAINGYEKVKSSLVDGTAKVLIQAKDGSVNQKRKLRPPSGKENYINCLTSKELGEAFGRNYVVHVSLTSGGLSKRVVHEASRLNKLRGFEPLETIILEGTNNN